MRRFVGEFITESLAIFPPFNCGLEINCDNGLRISAGRKESFNLWGLNPVANPLWLRLGVDPWIKVGNVYDIPYPSGIFDWVVYHEDLNNLAEDNRDEAMEEVIRVGSDKFLLRASLEKHSAEVWIDYLIHLELYPEVLVVCTGDFLDIEARKNWL